MGMKSIGEKCLNCGNHREETFIGTSGILICCDNCGEIKYRDRTPREMEVILEARYKEIL
jgi:hypothetical protein